jgi:hypothetical protein
MTAIFIQVQQRWLRASAISQMYFCNSRCLCLPEGDREQAFVMTLPDGKKRSFDTLVELAQWSAANAIRNLESEWLTKGREAL